MTTILPRGRSPLSLVALLALALPTSSHAQAAASRTSYWFTAGAGWAAAGEEGAIAFDDASAFVGGATLQRGTLVASARGVRTTVGSTAIWDAGILAGVGSPVRYPVRGSIAAGLGRITGLSSSAWTLPVELQLAWRVSPHLAIAAYGFGSFTGPHEMLGASVAVQLGTWH